MSRFKICLLLSLSLFMGCSASMSLRNKPFEPPQPPEPLVAPDNPFELSVDRQPAGTFDCAVLMYLPNGQRFSSKDFYGVSDVKSGVKDGCLLVVLYRDEEAITVYAPQGWLIFVKVYDE